MIECKALQLGMPLGSGPSHAELMRTTTGFSGLPPAVSLNTERSSTDCDGTYRFMDGTVKRRVLLLQLLEIMISRAAVKSGDADCVEFLLRARHPHGPPPTARTLQADRARIHWLVDHGVARAIRMGQWRVAGAHIRPLFGST